jgi:hypothetical protein
MVAVAALREGQLGRDVVAPRCLRRRPGTISAAVVHSQARRRRLGRGEGRSRDRRRTARRASAKASRQSHIGWVVVGGAVVVIVGSVVVVGGSVVVVVGSVVVVVGIPWSSSWTTWSARAAAAAVADRSAAATGVALVAQPGQADQCQHERRGGDVGGDPFYSGADR